MSDETRSEEERAKFKSQLAEFADAGWRAHYEQTAKAAAADLIRRREAIMATLAAGMLSTDRWTLGDVVQESIGLREAAAAIMEAAR